MHRRRIQIRVEQGHSLSRNSCAEHGRGGGRVKAGGRVSECFPMLVAAPLKSSWQQRQRQNTHICGQHPPGRPPPELWSKLSTARELKMDEHGNGFNIFTKLYRHLSAGQLFVLNMLPMALMASLCARASEGISIKFGYLGARHSSVEWGHCLCTPPRATPSELLIGHLSVAVLQMPFPTDLPCYLSPSQSIPSHRQ